jgi:hypothetical protein
VSEGRIGSKSRKEQVQVPLPKFRIEGCQDRDGRSKFSMENSRDHEDRRIDRSCKMVRGLEKPITQESRVNVSH